MGKETRGSVRDRALGSVGLFLIALIGLASGWGRTGRVVIWLVAAIGWLVDRVPFEHVLGSGQRGLVRQHGPPAPADSAMVPPLTAIREE